MFIVQLQGAQCLWLVPKVESCTSFPHIHNEYWMLGEDVPDVHYDLNLTVHMGNLTSRGEVPIRDQSPGSPGEGDRKERCEGSRGRSGQRLT